MSLQLHQRLSFRKNAASSKGHTHYGTCHYWIGSTEGSAEQQKYLPGATIDEWPNDNLQRNSLLLERDVTITIFVIMELNNGAGDGGAIREGRMISDLVMRHTECAS